jgi:nicotinate-nucleotide adenylyltransferase
VGRTPPRRDPAIRPVPASQCDPRSRTDTRRSGVPRTAGLALLIPLAILGGTFDPVHYGHLRLAADVRDALAPIDVRLVPAGDPPHRDAPRAPARDRVAMLMLALDEFPGLALDTREIVRAGKSYTFDTLCALRAEAPQRPLLLLVGADAFRGLPTWHRWRELFDVAHVVVIPRPGLSLDDLPPALARPWRERRIADPGPLRETPAGSIYVQPVAAQPISSTAIRALLAREGPRSAELAGLLPAAVLAYIETNRLYS